MTFQMSVRCRNAGLNAYEAAIGTSPTLKIFGGPTGATMPANVTVADAGTVLATMALPPDWMSDAANGQKSLTGTWQDVAADASGYAAYVRVYASDGACDWQFLVGQQWQANTLYAVGQQVYNGSNTYRCTTAGTSAASGGPTGAGTGIADNGAVWSYIGTKTGQMDNTSIALGQQVTCPTFTLTAGNA
ncbi:hypothetical protein JDN40_14300 [Rhodomicrobium vannielii ATCC 17100]|uniref:hypothetical protein n=1 Tax=Rhodomicrobium vannielii TaxID=1069 RepID=UPI001919383A|nr:hypothetical protein [Rhodomicrobium vannielii]MBJ7535279.1 hypothetical protein [Rhodomicrobium vannielii ATCC 17100]